MDKMISKLKGQKIEEGDDEDGKKQQTVQKLASDGVDGQGRWGHRSASYSDGKPRRLSYMGDVTEQDEKKFSDLYKELKEFSTEQNKTTPAPAS